MRKSQEELICSFSQIVGVENVYEFSETNANYGKDQTLDMVYPFDILIKPHTAEEISNIMRICSQNKIPVTPRGGGSGVTGGALPINRGVVLSLERLNKIIFINEIDSIVMAESGVITADLCREVEKRNLYFPVKPSSCEFSFIGGNVAENSGSVNSYKYGSTGRYVLNLEVVLPNGDIVWTGANVSKNSTGYNLTQLFVGSEGTLGIITKIVLRLLPKNDHTVTLLSAFHHIRDACAAIIEIKRSGIIPFAAELIGEKAIAITSEFSSQPFPLTCKNIKAHLIIEIQEVTSTQLDKVLTRIGEIIQKYSQEDILIGASSVEKEKLWRLRYNIGSALTASSRHYRDIDVCVPLSNLQNYIDFIDTISLRYEIDIAYFGHALDGNLHTMLVLDNASAASKKTDIENALNDIYSYAISLGGVISGEHGIGILQKCFMNLQFSNEHIRLMQKIKQLFDPQTILNAGKIV